MFHGPDAQRIQQARLAQQPDGRRHRSVEDDVGDDVGALLAHETALPLRARRLRRLHGSARIGGRWAYLGGDRLAVGIADDDVAAQQVVQGGGDAGDATRPRGDPHQPVVDLLGPDDQPMLLAQVVDDPGRGQRDRRVLGEQLELLDLLRAELVRRRAVAVQGAEHSGPGDQGYRQDRPVALLAGDLRPGRIRLRGDVGNRARPSGSERPARWSSSGRRRFEGDRAAPVHAPDVLVGKRARPGDRQARSVRTGQHHAAEVQPEQVLGGRGDEVQQRRQAVSGVHRRREGADRRQPRAQLGRPRRGHDVSVRRDIDLCQCMSRRTLSAPGWRTG